MSAGGVISFLGHNRIKITDMSISAYDCKKVIQSRHLPFFQKVQREGADLFFITVQGLEIGAQYIPVLKAYKYPLKVGAAGLSVVKDIVQGSSTGDPNLRRVDRLESFGSALYRVTDLYHEKDWPHVLAMCGYIVVSSRARIQELAGNILGFFGPSRPNLNEDFARGQQRQTANLVRVLEVNHIAELVEIPPTFVLDGELNRYRCKITGRPIRFIYKIRNTKIYYEKATLLAWFSTRPRERPPGWPETVPYQKEEALPAEQEQEYINNRLQDLLDDLQVPLA